MAELYRQDPALALQVMNDILEDPEAQQSELLVVLRQIAKAHGGVQELANKVNLNPTQLYRTLSPQGNPGLSSLMAILRALGLHLAVRQLGEQAL
jgi:probable addiction module antidote protein